MQSHVLRSLRYVAPDDERRSEKNLSQLRRRGDAAASHVRTSGAEKLFRLSTWCRSVSVSRFWIRHSDSYHDYFGGTGVLPVWMDHGRRENSLCGISVFVYAEHSAHDGFGRE